MAKTDPSLDFYCAHYIAAVKCSSVVLFTGLNILCRLLIFFLWNDHSRNRISTGASTIPAHDSSLYGWMLIAVVPALALPFCRLHRLLHGQCLSPAGLCAVYAPVALHTLAHDSGEGSCCLSEEQGREFPTQGAQAWSHLPGLSRQDRVFLGCDCMDKHTNSCFSQAGLSLSSNVDFSKVK